MMIAAFVSFFALIASWLIASNIEGAPEQVAEPAPLRVEAQPVA